MIHTINEQLQHCQTLLVKVDNNAAAGFWELFAVTRSSFMLNWWYETHNHLEGWEVHPIVKIATKFSSLWTRALSPELCTAAGIDEANRDAFVAWLQYINTHHWDFTKLATLDVIYTPEAAAKVQIRYEGGA
jgi:hypothetical protein